MSTNYVSGLTFECDVKDNVACIETRRGSFVLGTDLEEKQRLFDLFADLEADNEIEAVLIFNADDAFTASEHGHYIDSLVRLRETDRSEQATRRLEREDNAFDQYMLMAARYEKLIISCLDGEIATPFIGLGLASDVRLVTRDTQFRFSHVEQGVPPSGGLGFTLPKYVGQGRAQEWLLSGGIIDSSIALQLGLVNAVFAADTFESDCISWVRKMLRQGVSHIRATRRLLHHDVDAFGEYLKEESRWRRGALYRTRKDS